MMIGVIDWDMNMDEEREMTEERSATRRAMMNKGFGHLLARRVSLNWPTIVTLQLLSDASQSMKHGQYPWLV